jgi:hypothetical protein
MCRALPFSAAIMLTSLLLTFDSCKKDDTLPAAPQISSPGTGPVTLKVGEKIALHPVLNSRQGARYEWSVNGQPAGTDSTYTFLATTRGNYQVKFTVLNPSGTVSHDYQVKVLDAYENGFFIINEGWFGHETGTVFFYNRSDDSLYADVYRKENPDKALGTFSSTLQYAAMYQGKMYMVVKVGGPLVTVDPYSLKETGRIASLPGNNGVSFAGISADQGILGTNSGLYLLGLSPLTLGTQITGLTGAIGDMVKARSYVFVASQKAGLSVLSAGTYGTAKTLAGVQMGPVISKDSTAVWAIAGNNLLKINAETLGVDTVKLSFTAASIYGAWHSTSMVASTTENALFFTENKSYSGMTRLFKYIDGNAASIATPFITLPAGQFFYGKALGYNAPANELIVTTINGAFTGNINRVLFYNAETGELKKTITYNGWHFPAMPVFY